MERLLEVVRDLAAPTTWSSGVELARTAEIQEVPSADDGERTFRVVLRPRDAAVSVSLSDANEVWQSDCSCSDDPCRHVIATVLAVRQGRVLQGAVRRPGSAVGRVVHSFARENGYLSFARFLEFGESRRELQGTLNAALRSIKPGEPSVAVCREDEQVDHVLPAQKRGILDPRTMRLLLSVLARLPGVELDGTLLRVSSEVIPCVLEVVDDEQGFLLRVQERGDGVEVFRNGVGLTDDCLCAVADTGLTADEWHAFRGGGKRFSDRDAGELASVVIPALEGRIAIDVKTTRLPKVVRTPPRIVLETVGDAAGEALTVIPHLVYGEPPVAEVYGERIESRTRGVVPVRDKVEEARLARDLQGRLFLRLNEAKVFVGESAVNFTKMLRGWEVQGSGSALFTPALGLTAVIQATGGAASLNFSTPDGRRASNDAVLSAWRGNGRFVRLEDGGWGELPRSWLEAHRAAALRLLETRDPSGAQVAQRIADVEEICDSLNVPYPAYIDSIRRGLSNVEEIPEAKLPNDLQASLRPYQQVGVNWLAFLRENALGALLADDMGLGKTLQVIAAMRGLTLVVAPTSVLFAWEEQLKRFRPSIRVCRYHGPARRLDLTADLVITTYALLRLDCDALEPNEWDTIVLDESQTIKNPDSQVARAAYRLKGKFRVNLSGTPVENSLEDLWSQFHFLNPGLLGSRGEFEESFAAAIRAGDGERAGALRKRVAPFMLRRLKKDVARELPPKTEVVLECELDDEERIVYDAILGASRSELLAHLDAGDDLLSVFETLLRLRQACCHRSLIPGQSATSSSKVRLLIDCLSRSIEQGHRALVFSQWTSLLDLVEPELNEKSISWCRIDGSTQDRDMVVRDFQRDDGPGVMLLSLKAGGVGLTLTAADHVYILDPWWNPAVEDQAADRAYRIGQENPVIVHRLVARDSVEERVLELQAQKRGLLDAAVGESNRLGLTREDILKLIA